jgi:hypothetical protein
LQEEENKDFVVDEEFERTLEEENLKEAENKLSEYVAKWTVKTVELNLDVAPDDQTSTYDETND